MHNRAQENRSQSLINVRSCGYLSAIRKKITPGVSRVGLGIDNGFTGLVVSTECARGFVLFRLVVGTIAKRHVLGQAAGADPGALGLGFDFDGTGCFVADKTCHGKSPKR